MTTVKRLDSDGIAKIGVINQDSVNCSAELAADYLAGLSGEVLSPEQRLAVAKLFGAEYTGSTEGPNTKELP
jgi:hypothetical protein